MPITEPFDDSDRDLGHPADRSPTSRTEQPRHVRVDTVTRFVANPLLRLLVRLGWGVRGVRILTVDGRRSGRERQSIVIPIVVDGALHLVAPRGDTDWVRNLRAAGRAGLRLGRRRLAFTATELPTSRLRTAEPPIAGRPIPNPRPTEDTTGSISRVEPGPSGEHPPRTAKRPDDTDPSAEAGVEPGGEAEVESTPETTGVRVLRTYLRDNRALVAGILGDLGPDSSGAELAVAAEGIPMFRLDPVEPDTSKDDAPPR